MFKRGIVSWLNRLGLLRLLRWLHRKDVIIVYLHGVADPGPDEQWRPLRLPHSTAVFDRQIDLISRHYTWVSIDDAVAMISGKSKIRPYSIVLTFDDGYRNNLTEALPLARQRGIRPAFFIATGFVNNRKPFWFDRFDYAVQQIEEPVLVTIADREYRFEPGNREGVTREYARLRNHAKSHFSNDQEFCEFFDKACDQIERACGRSIAQIQERDRWSATMSDGDLAELAEKEQATIGSHTVDHIRLDKMPMDTCRRQLEESRVYLEQVTRSTCRHFCYPNGSFNDDVADLVANAGYESAVTTTAGFNKRGDGLFQLHRFHLPDSADEIRILSMLSGLYLLRDRLTWFFRGRHRG
jgi:peptidoglycan/xylan/chitin deacetylase (PgdA/CDA1 family)